MTASRVWHGAICSRGDQSYSHLHAAAGGRIELALHLESDHGVTASAAEFGSWCRDVETHAAAHGVTLSPTAASGDYPSSGAAS